MTLEDAINYANTHNNSIKNAEIGLKDAELQIKQTKASGLPQLNGEVSFQHFLKVPQSLIPDFISPSVYGVLNKEGVKNASGNVITNPALEPTFFKTGFVQPNTLTAGLTLSQLLFSGSYTVGLRASKLYKSYAEHLITAKKIEIKNQVIDAYLPALLISENVKTLDKNITNLEKLLFETKATLKSGFIEQLDVDRLELSLNNLKTTRNAIAKQREIVVNALKMIINYSESDNLELTDDVDKLLSTVDNSIVMGSINYENRDEYKTLQKAIELNKLNVDLNKAGYLPNVAAFGSYNYQLTGSKLSELTSIPNAIIGISGKVNIWDSWEKKSKIQRAQLTLDQLSNQRKDLESVINMQVNNAKISYNNILTQVESQKSNLILAEKIYKTTQIKYKEGIGSSFEMVQAEQGMYQAQQNVKQAQYDLLVAYKMLQKYLGK
jgi:outer membrane protein